ncbi:MAG TPA: hypothetical protein PKE45_18140, partial [Caldilineaceae bacterium]|nr:hypothetical protein [Caldilineaceae bacterium]
TRIPILVEGLEDISYITTELHLWDQWPEFRRLGCHLIPVNGKDKLIQPLAIAVELGIPVFVIFDSDGDQPRQEHRKKHEKDNLALFSLLGINDSPFPTEHIWRDNCAVWKSNLTDAVKEDFGDAYAQFTEKARQNYAIEGGLEKNHLFIADWLSIAHAENRTSTILERLCQTIIAYAKSV